MDHSFDHFSKSLASGMKWRQALMYLIMAVFATLLALSPFRVANADLEPVPELPVLVPGQPADTPPPQPSANLAPPPAPDGVPDDVYPG